MLFQNSSFQVTTVVFDKTGTITEGKPRVVAILALKTQSILSVKKLALLIGSTESLSEHPIGAAIAAFAKQFLEDPTWAATSRFHVSAGHGVTCRIEGVNKCMNLLKTKANVPVRFDFCALKSAFRTFWKEQRWSFPTRK